MDTDTLHAPATGDDPEIATGRRLLVAGVAAAVAAAVAETSAALRGSGRTELRWHEEWDDLEIGGTDRYEFSGDDVSVSAAPPGRSRATEPKKYRSPTLFAALGDVTFEAAGNEDVDGVPTRHLRAASPEDVDPTPLSFGLSHSGVTVAALDVWVDDDDLVRRIDLSTTRDSAQDGHFVSTFSIRLFDFGA